MPSRSSYLGPKFEPEEATAHAGDVAFFLRNDKGDGPPAVHNFLIGSDVDSPPLAASPTLMNGESILFTVYGLEAGTYTYWCTLPSPDGARIRSTAWWGRSPSPSK